MTLPTELKMDAAKLSMLWLAHSWYTAQPDFLNEVLGDSYHENYRDWVNEQVRAELTTMCGGDEKFSHLESDPINGFCLVFQTNNWNELYYVKLVQKEV